jgi:hypothetical protein
MFSGIESILHNISHIHTKIEEYSAKILSIRQNIPHMQFGCEE